MSCFKAGIALAMVMVNTVFADPGQPLTADGIFKRDPCFIDGGTTIVYCHDDNTALVRMMKLDVVSGTVEPFFADAGNRHHIEPAFSRDGRYVTFTECVGNLTARLVIRDLEEMRDSEVTHEGRGGTRSPTFTPTNDRVLYAFAETGPQQLWSVDLQGKEKRQITHTEGISNWPSVTHDGLRIVFANSRTGNYEIYSANLAGEEEQQLTENDVQDIRPTLSPEGGRIAFTSNRDGNYEIYVMNTDGTNVVRVTQNPERDDYPSWHPDGQHLVIVSERQGRHDLYSVEIPAEPGGNIARNDERNGQ